MESRHDANENKVLAYFYDRVFMRHRGGNYKIKEFYLPSDAVCFNLRETFPSNVPNYIEKYYSLLTNKMHENSAEPVTATFLPLSLVEIIHQATTQFPNKSVMITAYPELHKNPVFLSLFAEPDMPDDSKLLDEDEGETQALYFFWEAFNAKGNTVLKEAIVSFIEDGVLPIHANIDDIFLLMTRLDELEKQSLGKSIRLYFAIQDGKMMKRDMEIEQIDAQFSPRFYAAAGAGAGAVASPILPVGPAVGATAGLLGGSAYSYVKSKYNKYHANALWDQREQRAKLILDRLEGREQLSLRSDSQNNR